MLNFVFGQLKPEITGRMLRSVSVLCWVVGGLYFWLSLVQLAKMWGSVSLEKTGVKFLCASGWQGQQVYRGRGVTELYHMQDSEKHECVQINMYIYVFGHMYVY